MDSLSNKTKTLVKNISKDKTQYEAVINLFKNRIYDYYSTGTHGSYPVDATIQDIFSEAEKYILLRVDDFDVFKKQLKHNSEVDSMIVFFIIGSKKILTNIDTFVWEVYEKIYEKFDEDSSCLYGWEIDDCSGEESIDTTIILTGIDTWKIK